MYEYKPKQRKARGDVDPESRASFGSGKNKGKGRQEDSDASDEDEDLFQGEGIVEFTGVKPKGLKMGLDSDEEDQFDDDEEIDSDEAFEDEEDLPAKPSTKTGKVQCFGWSRLSYISSPRLNL